MATCLSQLREEKQPTQGRLQEYATPQPGPITVEDGVLKNVLLLGTTSRNRADYSREVMQDAVSRYEGAACYVGHTRDGSNPEYDRKLGVHRNVHVAADGIRGDLHFNPKHRLASQLVWDATHDPGGCGLSHDADCTYTIVNGRKRVTKIDRVYSCDLVTRPGTTRGLFEDEQQVAADPAPSTTDWAERARAELVYASELTPAYRDALIACLPENERPASVGAGTGASDLFGRAGHSRVFEAEHEATAYRPGDWVFGTRSGGDPVFGGTAPAPAAERSSYAYGQRLQEAAAARRTDPEYDAIFSGGAPEAVAAGDREFDHLFSSEH